MPFVVDASIAATWLMPDEEHPTADAARRRLVRDFAIAPTLWWFEIRNMLVVNERRGRTDADYTAGALVLLGDLAVRIDNEPDEQALFTLARRHRLTIYDAAYLEAALRHGIPLATFDKALASAARAQDVQLIS